MIYLITYYFTKILSLLYFPRTVIGLDNIPSQGGVIFACNHISNLDPPIMGITSPRRLYYVAKDSLFKNKLLGFILKELWAFPIKRDESDFRAMRQTLRCLKTGHPVLIFPEGTRGAAGRIKEVQAGIGFIAAKSGMPVVPVFIHESDKVLPPKVKWFRRHSVRVVFGKPRIYLDPAQSYPSIAEEILRAIIALESKIKDKTSS